MDFQRALAAVGGFLEREGAPYAVVGGLALAAFGIARPTFDLDLVTSGAIQPRLLTFLSSLGYETLHASAGYSNHAHTQKLLPRLDVVYVRGETEEKLFAQVEVKTVLPGFSAPVPRPEHLAAMKVQAIKNDPERRLQDLADIQSLLRLPGVDRAEVRGYFERHGLGEDFDALGT